MLRKQRMAACFVAAVAIGISLAVPARAQTPDEVRMIREALPQSAAVQPANKRRLLVFSLTTDDTHDSIPWGETAFRLMGEVTGAYEATLSRDLDAFEPANLSRFDAILLNNASGELFTSPSVQQALTDFVKSGKGLAGIHGAAACSVSWPGFGDLLGAYLDGHPGGAVSRIRVKADDPAHPLAKAFGGDGFDIMEAIPLFKDPFSRHKVRVLASLDTEKRAADGPADRRADGDYPVSWVRTFGKGRVFYCALGHSRHVFHDPRVLKHYLDGIQFVLGDLEADAEPDTARALEMQNRAFDAAEASLRHYDYGTTESASAIFDSLTRATNSVSEARRAYVARLVAVAANPGYSIAARELALRHIPYSADEQDVAPLFLLLKHRNPKIAEMTRYALTPLAGASVTRALQEAAESVSDETLKAGLVHALGVRRDQDSVPFLAELAGSSSPVVAAAAIDSLGLIGSPYSALALQKVLATATDASTMERAGTALVRCAGLLAEGGDHKTALAIYTSMLKETGSPSFRLAAFTGHARLSPDPGGAALDTLLSEDRSLHSAAASFLTTADDETLNARLAAAIRDQKPETQIALLDIAASRKAREAMEPARALLAAPTTATRSAAISALGVIGDKSVVPDLLKIAADKGDEFGELARTTLDQIQTTGVDELLIGLIDPHKAEGAGGSLEAGVIAQAIQAIGRRELTAAVPALLENARLRQEDSLKSESYDVLARLARAEDARPLLEMNYQITSQRVRTRADRALLAAIRKMEPAESQAAFLIEAIDPAPGSEARASILKLLGRLGGESAFQALRKYLGSEDETLRDAAIRALADFPSAEPLDDLAAIARDKSARKVHRVLALRGAARMLGLGLKRDHRDMLQLARGMLSLAESDEDKKLVIANLAEVKEPGILELITPMLGAEALAAETRATILKLAPHVWKYAPRETSRTLAAIAAGDGLTGTQKEELARIAEQMDALTSAVTGWQVAGPYTDPAARDAASLLASRFAPETSGKDSVDWKPAAVGCDAAHPEALDLEKALGDTRHAVAYLRTWLDAEEESTATLRLGAGDGVQMWVNGREVLSEPGKGGSGEAGGHTVTVTLSRGLNELVAKVIRGEGPWRTSVLVESPDGGRLPGVSVKAFAEAAATTE